MAHPTRSNDDVLQDLLDVHYRDNVNVRPLVLGRITEYTTRNSFEYAERRHPDDSFTPDMPHILDTPTVSVDWREI